MLENEYRVKLDGLEPEIVTLRDRVKYLSEINMKVKEAQVATEGFVKEVVSVNELLAKSLKRKRKQIKELSRTRQMKRSESCSLIENGPYNKLSEQPIDTEAIGTQQIHRKSKLDDTSCDSEAYENERHPRFFGSGQFSFKKRACSTSLSHMNAF